MYLIVIEIFSGYLDFYSPILKVVITLIGTTKLLDVRAILDIGAEVSIITLDTIT